MTHPKGPCTQVVVPSRVPLRVPLRALGFKGPCAQTASAQKYPYRYYFKAKVYMLLGHMDPQRQTPQRLGFA